MLWTNSHVLVNVCLMTKLEGTNVAGRISTAPSILLNPPFCDEPMFGTCVSFCSVIQGYYHHRRGYQNSCTVHMSKADRSYTSLPTPPSPGASATLAMELGDITSPDPALTRVQITNKICIQSISGGYRSRRPVLSSFPPPLDMQISAIPSYPSPILDSMPRIQKSGLSYQTNAPSLCSG